ncbi:MAG: GNAT family N-acetyltransferase [Acutalibacteraceae bacterium]|nr:GNAT family N-acetyltransferase [Acutalibacteraceae bacterium]
MSTLYTNRLVLRPFKEEDAQAVYKNWTYDERVAKYCRWYPHKSVEDTVGYLKMCCINAEYCWAITLKENDEPIGAIDLVDDNEIGYVLAYDYWGKGIVTEAVKAVIEELFNCGFEKISACHAIDNPASGKVMEKCGMTYVRNRMALKKFGSDELCEVKYYEISRP